MYISIINNHIYFNPASFQSRTISNELLNVLPREGPPPPPSTKRSGRKWEAGSQQYSDGKAHFASWYQGWKLRFLVNTLIRNSCSAAIHRAAVVLPPTPSCRCEEHQAIYQLGPYQGPERRLPTKAHLLVHTLTKPANIPPPCYLIEHTRNT